MRRFGILPQKLEEIKVILLYEEYFLAVDTTIEDMIILILCENVLLEWHVVPHKAVFASFRLALYILTGPASAATSLPCACSAVVTA